MIRHSQSATGDLTKNQSLVMNTLAAARTPLSAYTILDELRDQGLRAPLQIYRALDKLVEFGLVHRLESLNAFVACQHPSCEGDGDADSDGDNKEAVLFTICEECGSVEELVSENLVKSVNEVASNVGFTLTESVIELRGFCSRCKTDQPLSP